jgi:hypothetical protein
MSHRFCLPKDPKTKQSECSDPACVPAHQEKKAGKCLPLRFGGGKEDLACHQYRIIVKGTVLQIERDFDIVLPKSDK